MERPKRHHIGPRLIREAHRGPVDTWLVRRAEWMVKAAGIHEHLAPNIRYADKLAGKVERGLNILSIGTGKGHEIDEMDQLLPGSRITGLDPHDLLSHPVQKRLDTLAHDASYLPESVRAQNLEGIENESCDAVTLFFVLHHIEASEHGRVLEEVHRVLKPNGKLFIAEDIVNSDEERKQAERVDRALNVEIRHDNPHCYRSIEEWQHMFEKAGFDIADIREEQPGKVRHGFFVLQKSASTKPEALTITQ